jgi:hypothetical protein
MLDKEKVREIARRYSRAVRAEMNPKSVILFCGKINMKRVMLRGG